MHGVFFVGLTPRIAVSTIKAAMTKLIKAPDSTVTSDDDLAA